MAGWKRAPGAYGRALAAAEVSGDTAMRTLTPGLLSMIGRELIRSGEIVLLIEADAAGVRLIPVSTWDVSGGYSPDSWRYQCSLSGPTREITRTVAGASVVHVRYATEPARPWKGLAPLGVARIAGRLDAEIAHAMGDEASGPRGALIPTPKDGADPSMVQLRSDIKKLAGAIATVESTAASWDGDSNTSPRTDWGPRRLGAAWPAAIVDGASLAFKVVAAVCECRRACSPTNRTARRGANHGANSCTARSHRSARSSSRSCAPSWTTRPGWTSTGCEHRTRRASLGRSRRLSAPAKRR